MVEITLAHPSVIKNRTDVQFILFGKIVCNCTITDVGFNDWNDIKSHVENKLIEYFKNNTQQLEGKPNNLKTK